MPKSSYKGVCWDKQRSRWKSRLHIKGKSHYLGEYLNEARAAKAYDSAVMKLIGPKSSGISPN